MNRIRRLAALLLTLSFLLSMLPGATLAASPSFGDTEGHWAESAVARWAEYGVLTGGEDGNFAPDRQITRGEMAKIVAVMLGYETKAENIFTDLDETAWYAPYILMCLHMGVMTGDGAGHVRPNDPITRQEACKMLVVALGLTPEAGAAADFADSAEIADWAAPYVCALRKAGYIQGVGDGRFAPTAPITRASAVTILDNAVAGYITQPGVYSETYNGIVIVTCGGVTFKDAKVEGNLIAAQGLSKGDVTLENTTVTGTVVAPEGTVTEPAPQPTPTPKPNNSGGNNNGSTPDPTPRPQPTGVVQLNWNTYAMACGRSNGEGETLTLSVTYDKSVYTNAEVRWETTDSEIVALKADTGDSVTVQSRTTGFADVTATLYDGETEIGFDVCKISAIDGYDRATMQTLELTASELTLAPGGDPVTLTPIFYPVDIPTDGKMDTSLEIVDGYDTSVITVALKEDQDYAAYADIGKLAKEGVKILYDQVVVTPKAVGTTEFTIKSKVNGRTATCEVTVTEDALSVTGLTGGSSETIELTVGGDKSTQQLTVTPEGGETDIIWTSSNPYIATVDENGLVTARSTSNYEERRENSSALDANDALFKTVTITATSVQGGYSQTFKVMVKPQTIKATGISLNEEAVNVAVGGQDTFLYANVNPAAILAPDVDWTSGDEAILAVEEAGYTVFGASQVKLKPVAAGTTTVTAAYAGYEATCQVTVTSEVVKIDTIAIQGPSTLVRDQVAALTATVTAGATNQKVFWLSTDRTKVTVDREGNIQGYDAGDATIYAFALDSLTEAQKETLFFTADLDELADSQSATDELAEIRNISEDDEAKAKLEALLAADNVVSASYTVTVDGSASKYLRNLHIPGESITYESVALLWNRDSGYDTGDLEKTEVRVGGKLVATLDKEMSYTVKGLAANTTYTFQVTTYYGGGQTVSQTVTQRTASAPTRVLNVMEAPYNAVGDGSTLDTYAIQSAIDDCPAGGEVVLPAGHIFYSGALFLKSDMTFRVDGILMGSADPKDYPRIVSRWEGWRKIYQPNDEWAADKGPGSESAHSGQDNEYVYSSLLTLGVYDEGEDGYTAPYNLKNVTICGNGQVNGNGYRLSYNEGPNSAMYYGPNSDSSILRKNVNLRGHTLLTHNVRGLYATDVMIANAPAWTIDLIYSRDITLDNISVVSLSNYKTDVNGRNYILNGDGCDVDSSTHTNILNSFFRAGDDAIAAKSGKNREGWLRGKPTAYLRITDVFGLGSRYGIIIGSEMAGGAHDILAQNNEFKDNVSNESMWIKAPRERGGLVEDIVYRDIFNNSSNAAIRVEADYSDSYNRTPAPVNTRIRHLTYENISDRSGKGGSFKGKENSVIRNVLIRGSQFGGKFGLSHVDGMAVIDSTPVGFTNNGGVSNVEFISAAILADVGIKQAASALDVKAVDLEGGTVTVRHGTTLKQLREQIQPVEGLPGYQTYTVGEKTENDALEADDTLTVTARNGETTRDYTVVIFRAGEIAENTELELIDKTKVESMEGDVISAKDGTKVAELKASFRSALGGVQQYGVYTSRSEGEPLADDAVLGTGTYYLLVTAESGNTKWYEIRVLLKTVTINLRPYKVPNGFGTAEGPLDQTPSYFTDLKDQGSYLQVLVKDGSKVAEGAYFEFNVTIDQTATYTGELKGKFSGGRGTYSVSLIPTIGGTAIPLGKADTSKNGKLGGVKADVEAGDYKLRFTYEGPNTGTGHFTISSLILTPEQAPDPSSVEVDLEAEQQVETTIPEQPAENPQEPVEEPNQTEEKLPVDDSEPPADAPEQPAEEPGQAENDPKQPAGEPE